MFSEATPLEMVPVGTPERAWRLIQAFKSVWSRVSHTSNDLQDILAEIERERAYEYWPQDRPYGSLDELARREIGKSIGDLESHIVAKQASERVRRAAEATTGEVLPSDGSINPGNALQIVEHTQATRAKQNGIGYQTQIKLDRLARDFPVLAAEVRAGRMSVNRAAIEAGFIKPTATIRTDDIDHAAEVLARHFDLDEIDKIARLAKFIREGQ